MRNERYKPGIKYLTDKFDNRVGRVTRYIDSSSRSWSYARIDPNMDSISPGIEPDGSNSVHFFGRMRRGEGWASFLFSLIRTHASWATVIVLLESSREEINLKEKIFDRLFCRNPMRKNYKGRGIFNSLFPSYRIILQPIIIIIYPVFQSGASNFAGKNENRILN